MIHFEHFSIAKIKGNSRKVYGPKNLVLMVFEENGFFWMANIQEFSYEK